MRKVRSAVFALGLAAVTSSTGFAQTPNPEPATTFPELALRLPPQSFVVVTNQQGQRFSGKLIGIERDTLSIQADRAIKFAQTDVQHLQRKIPDSILDGGFLGFAAGMLGPMFVCMTISDSSETPSCVVYSIGFGGLPGFAVGAIVDHARGRTVTMFKRAAP